MTEVTAFQRLNALRKEADRKVKLFIDLESQIESINFMMAAHNVYKKEMAGSAAENPTEDVTREPFRDFVNRMRQERGPDPDTWSGGAIQPQKKVTKTDKGCQLFENSRRFTNESSTGIVLDPHMLVTSELLRY
jgi:hypothetical protein